MRIRRRVKCWMARAITKIYAMKYPLKSQILFDSFNGKQYSDNPRAISEKMQERFPQYDIVWALNSTEDEFDIIPDNIRIVKRHSIKYYKELAQSFCYVTNEDMQPDKSKRKGQFFIQTWHGDRAPKKVLYDRYPDGKKPVPVIDGLITDLCVAGSDVGERVYRTAFKYAGEILKVGSPRNDSLVSSQKSTDLIREKLGIKKNIKILLYAPTFRDNQLQGQRVNVDLAEVINVLKKNGDEWICLLRTHSMASAMTYDYSDYFRNVSTYPDMADLLLIADMLITDYSSSAGDFVLRDKPVVLTLFDVDKYNKQCREFSYNPADVGFICAYSQAELISIVSKYEYKDYIASNKLVINNLCIKETGISSDVICDRINLFYKKNHL